MSNFEGAPCTSSHSPYCHPYGNPKPFCLQDTRLLLWDLSLSDLATLRLPLQPPSFSSLTSIHPSAAPSSIQPHLAPSLTSQNSSQSEGSTSTAATTPSAASSASGHHGNNSGGASARPSSASSASGRGTNGAAATSNSNASKSNNARSSVLLLAPSRKEVPSLSPVVAHKVSEDKGLRVKVLRFRINTILNPHRGEPITEPPSR